MEKFFVVILVIVTCFSIVVCNKQPLDTTYIRGVRGV